VTYRKFTNLWWQTFEKTSGAGDYYTPADFVQIANLTGTAPNGSTFSVPNYKLKAGVPIPTYQVITTRPDYYHTYKGIDLFATKRMSNHFMLRGSVTWNDRKQHITGNGAIMDPTRLLSTAGNQFGCTSCGTSIAVDRSYGTHGQTYINAKWQYSLTSLVQLPWQMTFGANVLGRQGYPIPYYYRVNNKDGIGNKQVLVDDVDSVRLPMLFELDVRLAKDFNVGPVGLQIAAEGFNVTNKRTVLQRETRAYRSLNNLNKPGGRVREMQSPRIFRLFAKVSF
jgi:hypothetical protein